MGVYMTYTITKQYVVDLSQTHSSVYFIQSFCGFLTFDTLKLGHEKLCVSCMHNLEFGM